MRCKLVYIIVCLVLFSCGKKKYDAVQLIGHAGSGLTITTAPYHDNSYESVEYALETEGINGVEVDIQCSASGTAWLFHDPELNNQTNGSGCVNSSTDVYLQSLHYTTAEQEKLTKLETLQPWFGQKTIFLDIRSSNQCLGTLVDQQAVITAITNALPNVPDEQIFVITNKVSWVAAFYLEGWNVYLEVVEPAEYLGVSELTFSQTVGTCLRNSKVDKAAVEAIHEHSKEVIIFDVRSPKNLRKSLKKFPDYILVDDLKGAIIEKYR